jgi:hypothetical protein
MVVAFLVPTGIGVLIMLGLAISVAELSGGLHLLLRLRRVLPQRGVRMLRPVLRTAGAAALMALPAYLVAERLPALAQVPGGAQVAMVAAAVTGTAVFLLVQRLSGAPELALLRRGLRELREPRDGGAATGRPGPGGER